MEDSLTASETTTQYYSPTELLPLPGYGSTIEAKADGEGDATNEPPGCPLDHGRRPAAGWDYCLVFSAPTSTSNPYTPEQRKVDIARFEILEDLRENGFSYAQSWVPASGHILVRIGLTEVEMMKKTENVPLKFRTRPQYSGEYIRFTLIRSYVFENYNRKLKGLPYFTPSERMFIAKALIVSKDDWGLGINLSDLIKRKLLKQAFPLHSRFERNLLIQTCVTKFWKQPFIKLPLYALQEYLGQRITLYLAWLSFYTRMLIGITCFSIVICIIMRLFSHNTDVMAGCRFFYGLAIAFWSSYWLRYWQRRNAVLNVRWGINEFDSDRENVLRDEFNAPSLPGFYSRGGFVHLSDLVDKTHEDIPAPLPSRANQRKEDEEGFVDDTVDEHVESREFDAGGEQAKEDNEEEEEEEEGGEEVAEDGETEETGEEENGEEQEDGETEEGAAEAEENAEDGEQAEAEAEEVEEEEAEAEAEAEEEEEAPPKPPVVIRSSERSTLTALAANQTSTAERVVIFGGEDDADFTVEAPLTGRTFSDLPNYPFLSRKTVRGRMRLSGLLTFFVSAIVGTISFLILFYSVEINTFLGVERTSNVTTGVMTACLIIIADTLWKGTSIDLTEWENHHTTEQYENSLILKRFAFQFVSNYLSLFYIAFVKPFTSAKNPCLINSVGEIDCMLELRIQLMSVLITKATIEQIIEVIMPNFLSFILRHYTKSNKSRELRESLASRHGEKERLTERGAVLDADTLSNINPSSYMHSNYMKTDGLPENDVKAIVNEQRRMSYDGTIDDYGEIIIQYGFLVLFGVSFPLATVIMLLNNVIEMRTDIFKILAFYKRSSVDATNNIGKWVSIINLLSNLSVVTVVGMLTITTPDLVRVLDVVLPASTVQTLTDEPLICFVVAEHVLLAVRWIVVSLIEQVPSSTYRLRARRGFLLARCLNVGWKPQFRGRTFTSPRSYHD